MITETDIARISDACRLMPEPEGDYVVDDFLTNLVATVVDFQTHTTAVERALNHFTTRVRPAMADIDDLIEVMDRWPADQEGNTALARHLWGYNMWTRAQMLRDLVVYLTTIGVTDQPALRQWASDADFDRDFKGRVPGLGPAVFQWLVMRQGVDTVKPDVHVHRFVAAVLGRQVGDSEAIELIVLAARRIGRPAHRLDWVIWEAGRRGAPRLSSAGESVPAGNRAFVEVPGANPAAEVDPSIVSFLDDDAGYLTWIAAHPDGYVLNCQRTPSPRYQVLHRARCHTVAPKTPTDLRSWTIAYRKVCSLSKETLTAWATTQTRKEPTSCRTCRPSATDAT